MDGYCERLGPGLWAEPLNALTNLAFLVAALALWRISRGAPASVRVLALLIGAIFLGSTAWHTLATAWSSAADSGTIAIFMLYYLVLFARLFWGVPARLAWLAAPAFIGFAALVSLGLNATGIELSGMYLAAWLGLAILALTVRDAQYRLPLAGAALLFAVSLTVRTLDEPLCAQLPFGTHFLWHVFNAATLFLVAQVAVRKSLESRAETAA